MKTIHIIGGGTFAYVRNHLALAAPAFGKTASRLYEDFLSKFRSGNGMLSDELREGMGERPLHPVKHLTRMADWRSDLVTNEDVAALIDKLVADPETSVIIMNAALCDYDGSIIEPVDPYVDGVVDYAPTRSGKHEERLRTRDGGQTMHLTPSEKIIGRIRKARKDIFVVGFKTTTNATPDAQYLAGLDLLKANSLNLVVANDTVTRLNMIITPEEARYAETTDRVSMLSTLVQMVLSRSKGHFTRSTVVGSEADLVPWGDPRVPQNLRDVVDWCVANGAYKPFRGSTAGHFAVKVGPGEFLTSLRKRDFNTDLHRLGLVRVLSQDDNQVIAVGARPSVGGQSQRIVFRDHPETDCIVHFHCPLKPDAADKVPVRPQWQHECGSHECGQNTSDGLSALDGKIKAVMLDNHGPNIVFPRDVPPEKVIEFIQRNFDLSKKTGGLVA